MPPLLKGKISIINLDCRIVNSYTTTSCFWFITDRACFVTPQMRRCCIQAMSSAPTPLHGAWIWHILMPKIYHSKEGELRLQSYPFSVALHLSERGLGKVR
jgi:hypothetical protein